MDHPQVIAFAAALEMEFGDLQRRLQKLAAEPDLPTLEEGINRLLDELPLELSNALLKDYSTTTMESILATSYAEGVLTAGIARLKARGVIHAAGKRIEQPSIHRPEKAFDTVRKSGILRDAINPLHEAQKDINTRSRVVAGLAKGQVVQGIRKRLLAADGNGAEQAQAAIADEVKRLADLSTNPHVKGHADAQSQLAKGYGLFSAQQTKEYLDKVPFQEFYRAEHRVEWRDWPTRWTEQGGSFYPGVSDYPAGRMIAEVNSRIWTDLADPEKYSDATGSPYPPFAYNSGMSTKPVSLAEALKLGLHGQHRVPRKLKFNAGITFSVDLDDDIKSTLLDSVQDWVEKQEVNL